MEIEKLVQIITREVLKKVNSLEDTKLKVLILSNDENKSIKTALKEHFLVYDLKDIKENLKLDDFYAFVSPILTLSELANLSLGVCNCEKSKVFLRALLEGKRVFQINEGVELIKYRECKNTNLLNLYKGYLKKIETFGVEFISINDLEKSLSGSDFKGKECKICVDDNSLNKDTIVIKNKKLFTESELRKLYLKGAKKIVIDNSAIITSLADDFIRMNKLVIKKE